MVLWVVSFVELVEGFLLIFVPKKKKILNVLNNLFRLNFNIEFKGTQITHNSKYVKK